MPRRSGLRGPSLRPTPTRSAATQPPSRGAAEHVRWPPRLSLSRRQKRDDRLRGHRRASAEVTSEMRARAAAAWGARTRGARSGGTLLEADQMDGAGSFATSGRSRSSRGQSESRSTSATPPAKWCSTLTPASRLAPISGPILTGSTSPRCASTSSPGTASSPGRPASARSPRFSGIVVEDLDVGVGAADSYRGRSAGTRSPG